MNIRELWADARGPHADDYIWSDVEAAAFFGFTLATWKKKRCLREAPVAKLKAGKRGRSYVYRPSDCAQQLEASAA